MFFSQNCHLVTFLNKKNIPERLFLTENDDWNGILGGTFGQNHDGGHLWFWQNVAGCWDLATCLNGGGGEGIHFYQNSEKDTMYSVYS